MTKDKIQDFTLRVTHANKTEMIVILYDIALAYLQDAIDALDKGEMDLFCKELSHTRSVISELINSVDTSETLGRTILRLYIYMEKELTASLLSRDASPLLQIMHIISELREAYAFASQKDTTGPVMEKVEAVYTGLTYNRQMRNESVTDAASSRGFLA